MASNIRAQAFKFIQKGVELGLNATEIISSLSDVGLTYRRTDMLADIRSFAGLPEKLNVFQNIREDLFPSFSSLQLGGNFMSKLYRYDVELQVQDAGSDESFTVFRQVSSDTPLTRQQAADAVAEKEQASQNYDKREVLGATTRMGYYRQDALLQ